MTGILRNSLIISAIMILSLSILGQERFDPRRLNPDAPKETEQFGQLAGIWNAEQNVRNKDGTWSDETTRGEWRWYYILDGHAIQDDWFGADTTSRFQWVGTNIRIYNPEERQWNMAWIDKNNRRLATFTATQVNERIIMEGTNAKGRQIKNIFSNINEKSFDWSQQWTFDGGGTWLEVARIHCRRK